MFDLVGCINTSNGLEFDYVGVIIGKKLKNRNGKVLTDPSARAKIDKSLRRLSQKGKGDPMLGERIIKNTYKTLLTRGQKGCYIYCEEEEVQEYFKYRIEKFLIKNIVADKTWNSDDVLVVYDSLVRGL